MTEKLYYKDSHMRSFTVTVLECKQTEEAYEAVLDRTAFFPEGGGQCADIGTLGDAHVLDVQEKDGVIYHTLDKALKVGETYDAEINWELRFSAMQQHSGEHIVSGIVHRLYGYQNVGFHMGKDAITMDFDGVLTKQQLREIEYLANEVVVRNAEITTLFPTKEELQTMSYRSKMEIPGQVRLVVIDGCDCCACCAPHVKYTGEIGMIKLLGVQNYKGGARVSMLCGFRALADYAKKAEDVKELAEMFSAKEDEVVTEVLRIREELSEQKHLVAEARKQALVYKVQTFSASEPLLVLFEEELTGELPRELVNLLLEKGIELAAVFSKSEAGGYRYVIGSRQLDVRPFAKLLNESFDGRGGGKPEMVQGSIRNGDEEAIREGIEVCRRKV